MSRKSRCLETDDDDDLEARTAVSSGVFDVEARTAVSSDVFMSNFTSNSISIVRPIRRQFYFQFDLNFMSNSTSILRPIRSQFYVQEIPNRDIYWMPRLLSCPQGTSSFRTFVSVKGAPSHSVMNNPTFASEHAADFCEANEKKTNKTKGPKFPRDGSMIYFTHLRWQSREHESDA